MSEMMILSPLCCGAIQHTAGRTDARDEDLPRQSFGSQRVGEDRAGNAGRWSTQFHSALPRRLPASSPLHLSGSSERGQHEHNAGPALQD